MRRWRTSSAPRGSPGVRPHARCRPRRRSARPTGWRCGAVTTAFAGLWLLRHHAPRALLTGERVQWEPVRPERRHVVGSALFGVGWGVAGACPGPIATQLGQGIAWGIPTTVGLIGGILLFGRMQRRRVSRPEPAEHAPAAPMIPSPVAADATA